MLLGKTGPVFHIKQAYLKDGLKREAEASMLVHSFVNDMDSMLERVLMFFKEPDYICWRNWGTII
jgi:hypothetical protein